MPLKGRKGQTTKRTSRVDKELFRTGRQMTEGLTGLMTGSRRARKAMMVSRRRTGIQMKEGRETGTLTRDQEIIVITTGTTTEMLTGMAIKAIRAHRIRLILNSLCLAGLLCITVSC